MSTNAFNQELIYCNGATSQIVTAAACTIPLSILEAAPFNLALGDSVDIKVIASNLYGSSSFSSVGSGTFIYYVPDAPLALTNNPAVTAENVIGISWSPGVSNGNQAVIDYQVWGALNTGTQVILKSGVTTTSY